MKHIINKNKLITKRFYCNSQNIKFESTKLGNFITNSVSWGVAAGIVIGGIAAGDMAYGEYTTNKNTSPCVFVVGPICGMLVGGISGGVLGLTWPLLIVASGFSLFGAGTNIIRNGGFNYSIKIKKKKEYIKY